MDKGCRIKSGLKERLGRMGKRLVEVGYSLGKWLIDVRFEELWIGWINDG